MEQSVRVEDRILLATIECIEMYGVRGATNRRIAAQAGVNVAAMNYYFRSKEALIQRVMAMTIENAFDYEDFADFPAGNARERCMAVFDHLMTGGCTYPGLTRAHFTDLLSTGNYEAQVVMGMNQFVMSLAEDMARLGCALPPDELQLACMQITSAAMFIILAPRLFETGLGFNACDAAMRSQYLKRLIERLL
ncbi:MAG: TetR/AcrR family transcriptional regulator [Anaerolineae bacterium]